MSCHDYQLGESFSLYIRYANEMEYFGWEEDKDLSWLPEGRDEFSETLEKIYAEAFSQFKDYLLQVNENIDEHVGKFAKISQATPKDAELCRDALWNIWEKRKGRPSKPQCQIGGNYRIDETGEYCVVPWIWVRKAIGDEKRLQKIVGKNTRRHDEMAGFESGTVILGRESIKLRPLMGSGTALIEALAKPFVDIKGEQWKRILKLAFN
jgi:hypothetical protein